MADSTLIPREVLFGNPEKALPTISPDGTRMAYVAPVDGVLNVWVGEVGGEAPQPVTDDRDRGVRMYTWAHDNRHLLYLQDTGGDENWRLYSVDLETGETRDLTPFDGVQARVVKLEKHHPETVLVAMNRDNPQLHDVYRLDLPTGELTKVVDNPGFLGFVADQDLQVRAAVAPTPDGGVILLTRPSADADWQPVLTAGQEDALTTSPIGFSADGETLLVISSVGANAGRLVRLAAATGVVEQVIAEDATYDVAGAIVHPDTREVQAVAYLRDRLEWQVFDEAIRGDFEALAELSPGDLQLADRDHADRTWLVGFNVDDGPVAYYSWDREAKKATFLFHHKPDLLQYELRPMEPFAFTSRDGLSVHGYLTFPEGERTNLPTVLTVHGGPWARDAWGLDAEAQWLANRGYLCVQVNYRGSTGYGKDFVNAGDREWAGKMHDDLIDAVDHIVENGWADRERIAIYGGSYGGYAALVGATFTPDVFRCAVDLVGPSNLKTLIESVPPYWAPMIAQFHTRVGNPETDAEFLWSRSPLSRVDQIKIPMLIAQGANDPRVKQAESEQIVAAMLEKGIDHEYMLFPDEGHGFAKPENRLAFYAAAERFLARNLNGRCEEESAQLTAETA